MSMSSARRPVALLAAFAASLLLFVVAGGGFTPAAAAIRDYALTKGHIDLFEVTYEAGGLQLRVKDDTNLYDRGAQFRDPALVSVVVDGQDSAVGVSHLSGAFEFLKVDGNTVYQLPQTQDPDLPWPGWSTERLVGTLPVGSELPATGQPVKLAVNVEGPGNVFTWQSGVFGGVENKYIDTVDPAPDVISISRNAHVHSNWAFTKPGDYLLTVTPTATTAGGATLTGPAATYHFHISDPGSAPTPVATAITATPITQVYGKTAPLAVTVSPNAPGSVRVKTGSATLTGALTGGKAAIQLPAKLLPPGRHTATVSYPGVPDEFAPSTMQTTITVVKATPKVTIKAKKSKVRRGKTATFAVTVTGSGVKPTGKVTVKVGSKSKTAKLNSSSKATVKVAVPKKTKPGKRPVSVSYAGDKYVASGKTTTTLQVTK